MTLTSPGAVATATVAGSPYPITPSAAVGTGLGNYTISYAGGALTVAPAALTITANDRTKTYGQTFTFAGTEFSSSGLLNADSVTSVTLTSPGAAATATVAGSPYPITPSAAVGTGLANYTISYVNGALTVSPAALTITANDRTKTYGQTVVFAGTEFSSSGLLNADTVTSVTLTSPGAVADRDGRRQPYPITPSAAVGTGPRQLHDQLRRRRPDRHAGSPLDHRQRPDQDVRPDGHVRGHRVQHERPAQHRHRDERHPHQPGRGRPRRRSPAAPTRSPPRPRSAPGLGNYTISYVDGDLAVDPGSGGHRRDRLRGHL